MALEGTLRDLSLLDLIRIFRMMSKSGVLLLAGGPERGLIYVREGRLIDAAIVRGPEHQLIAAAEDAVLLLLQWQDASFTFRPDPQIAQHPTRIVHDHEALVQASQRRRASPLRAFPPQPIQLGTRLILAPLPSSAESGINLELNQWRVLSQVPVSRYVRDICAKTGLGADQTIAILSELIALGLVDVVGDLDLPAADADNTLDPAHALEPHDPLRLRALLRRLRDG